MNGDPLDELDEQAEEIARLTAELDRRRLTGGERNALMIASEAYALDKDDPICVKIAADLAGLLERLK